MKVTGLLSLKALFFFFFSFSFFLLVFLNRLSVSLIMLCQAVGIHTINLCVLVL